MINSLNRDRDKKENPYKNHKHDGGDDYGIVDCLRCEAEMLWNFREDGRKLDIFPKFIKTNSTPYELTK